MRFIETLAASLLLTLSAIVLVSGIAISMAVQLLDMSIAGAIAFYFVVWWTSLFVLLPIGIRSQDELGATIPGTEPGAPVSPRLRERAIMTTLLADVVFLGSVLLLPLAGL